jgi:hypothetical protein
MNTETYNVDISDNSPQMIFQKEVDIWVNINKDVLTSINFSFIMRSINSIGTISKTTILVFEIS